MGRSQFPYDGRPLKDGASLPTMTFKDDYEPTFDGAWASFEARFLAWLKDKPGMVLWLTMPTPIRELKGWTICAVVAVTEDERFLDEEQLAPVVPPIPKFPMMTPDEMLVRK